MRVTFIVPMVDLSGGARIIAGHARRLKDKGYDVKIVAPALGRLSLRQRTKSVFGRSAVQGNAAERSHYARAGLTVHRSGVPYLREEDVPDADVIVGTWWETAEWIWPLSESKGSKVHFIQHYEAFPEVPANRVDAVWLLPFFKIAVAQWLVDLAQERFGIQQVELVPNSVDHDLFRPVHRMKGQPATVGCIFHRTTFKDWPTTRGALDRLKQISPNVRFIAFGGTKPKRGELPLDCEFHLNPTQSEIAAIYGRCDAWLSPSRSEGFNLPPLEAMSSGCPAVCAKTGRPLEIIRDGVNGYLVDQGDIAGFAEALAKITLLPGKDWRRMSEAAIDSVAKPTWDESSKLFEGALARSLKTQNR